MISRGFNVISKIPYLKRQFPFKVTIFLIAFLYQMKESMQVVNSFHEQYKCCGKGYFILPKKICVSINMRERLNPPLSEGFFGNTIYPATITIKTA
ncbi:hypothetical protein P3L10_010781 [Capsicum annuum]